MYQRQVMDSEDALAAVDAVLALAIAEGTEGIAVAVVDDAGDLVAYARMDGAPAFHRKQAVRKAYTASRVGRGLGEFAAHCAGRGLRVGEFGDELVAATHGGGVVRDPESGVVLGAVGVQGMDDEQDERLARAGLAALESSIGP